jgi:hypothetical protein
MFGVRERESIAACDYVIAVWFLFCLLLASSAWVVMEERAPLVKEGDTPRPRSVETHEAAKEINPFLYHGRCDCIGPRFCTANRRGEVWRTKIVSRTQVVVSLLNPVSNCRVSIESSHVL